jgi:hypothetical protein
MSATLDLIQEYLRFQQWNFKVDTKMNGVRFGMKGKNANLMTFIFVYDELCYTTCFTVLPFTAPAKKRAAVAEYLLRVNEKLLFGNFLMDYDNGQVQFKTFIPFDGEFLSHKLVEHLILSNLKNADFYCKGLMQILSADIEPEAALSDIEATLALQAALQEINIQN